MLLFNTPFKELHELLQSYVEVVLKIIIPLQKVLTCSVLVFMCKNIHTKWAYLNKGTRKLFIRIYSNLFTGVILIKLYTTVEYVHKF